MNDIFHTAVNVSTPLGLAGLFGAILFFVIRTILRTESQPIEVVSKIINYLFILCLVGMFLGFAGWLIPVLVVRFGPIPHSHEPLPCEGEWRISIEYSRLFFKPTKYEGFGRANMTWKPSQRNYDVLIYVTLAEPGKRDAPLLTSVTQGTLEGDASGNPTATSMELEYRAQTGRAPYEKPPLGKIVYTDLQFDLSADGKRAQKIVGKYHSSRTDAVVTFSRP